MGRKNSKKRKTKEKSSAAKVYKGTVDMTRSGVAYIIVENLDSDIMVRQQGLNTALHGDLVWVEITKGKEGVGRMQGEVIKVVTRKRKEFVGRIEMNKGFAFFIPEMDRPMPDIYIPQENIGEAKNNERVVVRLVEWESSDKRPVGEVVHVLNIENENDLAMKEILLDSGFPLQFSDEALEVAARIPETITEDEISKRKDCRSILTFTIDPVDAKDFDDALSFRPLKNGNYEIGVHIADVSHYVETETALDKEAYERATSVYLPDRVNPMLPEHISNFLCSLRPKEDKLTFSAIFQVTPKGDVKQYWLGKTVIHSDHRFTYEDVQEMIEGKEGPYKEEVLLLNEMAQRMRKQRFKNGAINFSSQEVRFKLDEKGKPIGILIKESKEAHQLIEEFMLLANRKVAEHLSKIKIHNKPLPVPYRIHDDPDEEKLVPFVAFAKKFGHKFDMSSPDKIAESFNQLLKDAHGKPEQHVLEQLGIRTMAKQNIQ
jgi:ribonuclease R